MGYTIGIPCLKLSNVDKKGSHCGNLKKISEEALKERNGLDLDIDKNKSHLNKTMGFETSKELIEYIDNFVQNENAEREHRAAEIKAEYDKKIADTTDKEKIKQLKADCKKELAYCRKIRKDAVLSCVCIFKPPMAFMEKLTQEEQHRFLNDCETLLGEFVGQKNMLSRVRHADELCLHSHNFFIPLTEDGRLCGKEIFNLKLFNFLNQTLPEKLREKGWTDIDNCHAFDEAEEMEKRAEMGEEAYRQYRKEQKSKRGRNSASYKHEAEKEVKELQTQVQELNTEIKNLDAEKDEKKKQVAELTELTEQKHSELDTLQTDVDKISTELAEKTEAMQTVNAIQKTPRPELPELKLPDKPIYYGADYDKKAQWKYEHIEVKKWEKDCEKIKAQYEKDLQRAMDAQKQWDSINAPAEAIRQASAELTEREKAVKHQAAQIRETAKNLRKQQAQINNEVTKVINRHRENSPLLKVINKANREYDESHHIQPQETETVQPAEKAKTPVQARPASDSAQFRQQWAAFNAPKAVPRPAVQTPTAPRTTAPKTHTTTKNKGEYER